MLELKYFTIFKIIFGFIFGLSAYFGNEVLLNNVLVTYDPLLGMRNRIALVLKSKT